MSAMLKEQLVNVFSLMKLGFLFQYEPELDAFLEFLIWRFSIWVDKPTPGNALMNLSFPMVTGQLLKNDEGQWMIKCNDAGVRLVEVRAKGSVEGWLRRADREKELELVHWEDMVLPVTSTPDSDSLLLIPLLLPRSSRAWADITLGGKMLTPPLFQLLPLPKPGNKNTNHQTYTALIDRYETSIQSPTLDMAKQHATVTFGFTDEMVQSCIAMAKTVCAPNDTSLMPFEALAGLFWFLHGNVWEIKMDGLSEATFVIGEAVKKMEKQRILDLIERPIRGFLDKYDRATFIDHDMLKINACLLRVTGVRLAFKLLVALSKDDDG
ncbi:hypothetical protein RHSIM_Rhsim02G0192800 [Rhododendron simsii]|uniref:RING-type E3 ubiquitin transferase (cysteine targeting) n=1 Tax=Rhododendron simsii TaxID=118357 RepID=A0A834HHN8_RHOSS|nr:hypothetical protein RHSIM_Rhsim02G0192800 [Rhododendron simsii]